MWPFIGRDAVLAETLEAVRAGRSVVLTGGAGVGKTRLLDELTAALGTGPLTIVGSPTFAAVPFGVLSILGDVEDPGTGIAVLRRELGHTAGILRLENLQWFDQASAEIVAALVASSEATVVGTTDASTSIAPPFIRLWQEGHARRVEIAPLEDDVLAHLVEYVVGAPPDPSTLRSLVTATGGNLFLLRDVLGEAVEAVSGATNHGLWHLPELVVGDGLADVLGAQLDRLEDDEVDALALVSLAEPLDVAVVEHAGVSSAAERLETQGLLSVELVGATALVRVTHPLLAEHLRSRLGYLRRRRLASLLVDAVEAAGAMSGRARIAAVNLALDLGLDVEGHRLLDAAGAARSAFDCLTAERLARAAHASIDDVRSLQLLADVMYERSLFDERDALLHEWSLRRRLTPEAAIAIAVDRAVGRFWGLADGDGAFELLVGIADRLQPHQRARAVASHAALLAQAGRLTEAQGLLDDEHLGDELERSVDARWARCTIAMAAGAPDLDTVDELLAAVTTSRSAVASSTHDSLEAVRIISLAQLGRIADASTSAAARRAEALDNGDLVALGFAALGGASVAVLGGVADEVVVLAREAASAFARVRLRGHERWALGLLVLGATQGRDRDLTAEALRRLDALDDHPAALMDPTIDRARAAALVLDGRRVEAAALLRANADRCARTGARFDELLALRDLAVVDPVGTDVAPRAAELAARCDGDLAPALADLIAAIAAQDVPALALVSDQLASLGALRMAAEAGMLAVSGLADRGDARAAARLAATVQQLAARCGPHAPALQGADGAGQSGRASRLTAREREVAELAADGLTSRAIADRLFVSVRTVDNHLARVYTKLGVSGRSELTQ